MARKGDGELMLALLGEDPSSEEDGVTARQAAAQRFFEAVDSRDADELLSAFDGLMMGEDDDTDTEDTAE